MMSRFAIALFATAVLAGCGENHRWRQKMTVTVETPQGEKTGSAVVEVVVTVGRQPLTSTIEQYSLRGEATVVEVAPEKFLFALLSPSGPNATNYLAEHTFGGSIRIDPKLQEVDRLNAKYRAFSSLRENKALPRANYPLLVRFGDISDPTSVREIKPDNFADAFGSGFRLKSITLEITDEPITTGKVATLLAWLPKIWPNRLDGQRYETLAAGNRFANSLSANSFSTEIGK